MGLGYSKLKENRMMRKFIAGKVISTNEEFTLLFFSLFTYQHISHSGPLLRYI